MHMLRKATPDDAVLLTEIMVNSFRHAFAGFISSETIDKSTDFDGCLNMFRNILDENKMKVIVGNTNGILVWNKVSDDSAEILAIHTLPESWGTGLGYELLREGIDQMKREGINSVYLWAFKENQRARRFYEKHGLVWNGKERVSEFDEAIEIMYEYSINNTFSILGRKVHVTIDRPLGSFHPEHREMYYPVNYGYVKDIQGGDGEEQDVYVLGIDEPIGEFTGEVAAIVHRNDDCEDKWVVVPCGVKYSREEIKEKIEFQEKYFDSVIIM